MSTNNQNYETPFVRECIALWLAGTTLLEFSVADIMADIQDKHRALRGLDLCKPISNELIRLETQHRLLSRKGIKGVDGCGIGRPPRVYHKRRHDEPLRVSEPVRKAA